MLNETLARNLATAADRTIEQAERLTAERDAAYEARDHWQDRAAGHLARVAALTEALRRIEGEAVTIGDAVVIARAACGRY